LSFYHGINKQTTYKSTNTMKKNIPITTVVYCCLFFLSIFCNSLFAQTDFSEFPWLTDVIDTEDCCQNQRVIAYQSGIFTFIYIERGADCQSKGNELYFEDGTFYCVDASNYDCRTAYNLLEENATTLWNCGSGPTNETFTICAGESIFLPAEQEFSIPPLGPDGEQLCHPQLSFIDIEPVAGSIADGLKGFTVSPTETTLYEVVSGGICGGPGSSNADEISVFYEVIVEESEACLVAPDTCKALVNLNINPSFCEQCISEVATYTLEGETYLVTIGDNETCSDAITTVMHCDSTIAFCFDGGIAGFAQCERFFAEAILLEVIWSKAVDCEVAEPENCLPLEDLNINPSFCESCIGEISIYEFQKERYLVTIENNPICSDGITTVTNCDSTFAFCFDGGIAGFSQCNDFFEEAILIETIWSRTRDCEGNTIEVAPPCTDLEGIDFGLCEAVMGVGVVQGKCVTISGCLDFIVKGVDYSEAIFPTVEICEQTCNEDSGNGNDDDNDNESTPEIFETFPWLTDVIDVNDCKGTIVEVYDLGTFNFVFVQTETAGELYFENGGFYCMELPNYDCRALYNLSADQLTETWTCETSSGPSGPSSPIGGGNLIQTDPANTSARIKVFPNPTTGLVNVQLPTTQQQPIRVFDLFGRLVQEITTDANSLSLDLSGEDAGVYLLETWNDGVRAMVKVVKQ